MLNATRLQRKWPAQALALALVLGAVLLLGPSVASAKKPVSPPPVPPPALDTGTIYYVQGGGLREIQSDGTGDAALPASILYWAEPSEDLHEGRWFLQVQALEDADYPAPDEVTAIPRYELFAVHASGSPIVQLTDGKIDDLTYIEPNQNTTGYVGETDCVVRWADEDTIVSYTAVLTTYDADTKERTVQDGGIYALAIDPDALADHTATAMSGYPLLSLDLNATEVRVLAKSYDWKPDGSAIVYPNHHDVPERLGVWIAYASDGFTEQTLLMDEGTHLRWSADGSWIVHRDPDGIRSIRTDGTDSGLLVADPADTPQETISVTWPSWSPSGTHVAYWHMKVNLRKSRITNTVRIVAADGSDDGVFVTGSMPKWRD